MKTWEDRVIVCGTGTGVGKTHVACALVAALRAAGRDVVGLKPVETGVVGEAEDAARLARAGETRVRTPRYCYVEAVSPHLAARWAGEVIEVEELVRWIEQAEEKIKVVETAGGVCSPLAPGVANVDLVAAWMPCHVVLVAADRLGALHDVAATLHVLRDALGERGDVEVVLSATAGQDASVGSNGSELAALGICRQPIEFGRAEEGAPASVAAGRALWARLAGEAEG